MKELIQFKHNDFTLPGYVWKKKMEIIKLLS